MAKADRRIVARVVAEIKQSLGITVIRQLGTWRKQDPGSGRWVPLTRWERGACDDLLYTYLQEEEDRTQSQSGNDDWLSSVASFATSVGPSASSFVPRSLRPAVNAGTQVARAASIVQDVGGLGQGLGALLKSPAAGPIAIAATATVGAVAEYAKRVIGNINEARDLGGQAVGSVVNGALSATGDAFNAGAKIAHTLLNGLLRPFGVSGAAVGSFAQTTTSSIGQIFTAGGNLLGGALPLAGNLAGNVVGRAGGIMGGFYGGMTGGPLGAAAGMMIGTIVGVAAMKVVSIVADLGGKIVGTLGKAFGELGTIATSAVKTVLDVVNDAKNSALQYSSAVYNISAASGLGLGGANAAVLTRGAFGMSPQDVAHSYTSYSRMPVFQAPLNAAWGITGAPGSEENLRATLSIARNMDLLTRRMMLQQMPEGESFWLPLVNMPQSKIDRQLDFARGLAMPPEVVKAWQEDVKLLQDSWGQTVEFIKMTLGTAFLPAIRTALEGGTRYVKEHREEIVQFALDVGRWFYVKLPEYVLGGAQAILRATQTVLTAVADMLRGIRHGLPGFLEFIDHMVEGFRKAAAAAAALVAVQVLTRNPTTAWMAPGAAALAYHATLKAIPQSNLAESDGMYAAIKGLGGAERKVRGVADAIPGVAETMEQTIRSRIGKEEDRQRQYDQWERIAKATESTAEASTETARNTRQAQDSGSGLGMTTREVLLHLSRLIAEDAYMLDTRIS